MEETFRVVAGYIALALEAVAVLVMAYGAASGLSSTFCFQ